MKTKKITLLLPLFLTLSSCSFYKSFYNSSFNFDTIISYSYKYENDLNYLFNDYIKKEDDLFNAFENKSNNGVYALNTSNDYIEIDYELKQILNIAIEVQEITNGYFNPFIFNLSSHVKNFLNDETDLNHNYLESQKMLMESSYLNVNDNGLYKIIGEAKIDLGAIAKGYSLSKMKEILDENLITDYIFNFGHSSILVGKKSNNETFKVKLDRLEIGFECENIAIGVSSIYEQNKMIDGELFSHIINTKTLSLKPLYDEVVVLYNDPILCDVFSTSFMNMSIDLINEIRDKYEGLDYIIIKNDEIIEKSNSIKLYV